MPQTATADATGDPDQPKNRCTIVEFFNEIDPSARLTNGRFAVSNLASSQVGNFNSRSIA